MRHKVSPARLVCALAVCLALLSAPSGLLAGVTEQIDELLEDVNLRHGIQGVLVKSLKTGATIYERNSDLVLIPASNMKLLVSSAALDRLGPDFTWETRVYATGTVTADGTLQGDLIIKGGGDPVLETPDLQELAAKVKAAGIARIEGSVAADESIFDEQRLGWGWSWDDEPYYYSAQVSGLSVNRNALPVYVYPGSKPGEPAKASTVPQTSYVRVRSTAVTGEADSERTVMVDRRRGLNVVTVEGTIPHGVKVASPEESITVEEPAMYAAELFRMELARLGIHASRIAKTTTPGDARLLCSHTSPPLSEVLSLLNKPSDNLIAEMMLKTLGVRTSGKGSTAAGAEAETEFFKRIGMDLTALRIVDGSGLSRLNYVSPHNLVTLLQHMHSHRHSAVFIASLPVAGVDGTLASRMRGTAAQGNVRAKSGYVSRVSSLSGYLSTKSGEPLVFSIILNNHLCANMPARAVQDKICALLAEMP